MMNKVKIKRKLFACISKITPETNLKYQVEMKSLFQTYHLLYCTTTCVCQDLVNSINPHIRQQIRTGITTSIYTNLLTEFNKGTLF